MRQESDDRKILSGDCDSVARRDFLRVAGGLAAATAMPSALRAERKGGVVETKVKDLYDSLSSDQKKVHCFGFDHELRSKIDANWEIVKPKIEDLTPKQGDIVESIVKGLCSEDGYEKLMIQMGDDAGGLGAYHFAIFGEPGKEKFEFELTGRHCTLRADGNTIDGVAFGGPMVYGHAASKFTEDKGHPGNVWWYQGKRANEVFEALNPGQRKVALKDRSPVENAVAFRESGYPGLSVSDMSPDQKELVAKVMTDLLAPYRRQDVEEVMELLTANGGLEKVHMSFYKQTNDGKSADNGADKVWDNWRLEGPGFVWHFRGFPHVHTYVNIARAT